jgi:organic radical activating enzyme
MMFGKNKVTSPYRTDDGSLKIVECFYTIQGEGPDAGRPAIFLRLSHCNLRCYFCDTEFEKGDVWTFDQLKETLATMSRRHGCSLVVITGGEPLLQNVVPLTKYLNEMGIGVSVETAGTVYYDELREVFHPLRAIGDNLIVCSPKTAKVNTALEPLIGAYKYIVRSGNTAMGLPIESTQRPGERMAIFMSTNVAIPIYIQPMDEQNDIKNAANLQEAVKACLKHGYRLSVQMHKLANLP